MKYKIYYKNEMVDWMLVKSYKGHDLMVTQDGKIVCYIDGKRKVFSDNGCFKIVAQSSDQTGHDPLLAKLTIDEFLGFM